VQAPGYWGSGVAKAEGPLGCHHEDVQGSARIAVTLSAAGPHGGD
jgi:hypothetical protein